MIPPYTQHNFSSMRLRLWSKAAKIHSCHSTALNIFIKDPLFVTFNDILEKGERLVNMDKRFFVGVRKEKIKQKKSKSVAVPINLRQEAISSHAWKTRPIDIKEELFLIQQCSLGLERPTSLLLLVGKTMCPLLPVAAFAEHIYLTLYRPSDSQFIKNYSPIASRHRRNKYY